MMELLINDLSLTGQFASPAEFREALEPLLQFRLREPKLRDRLYCSRTLSALPVTQNANMQQAVLATADKSFIQQTLGWAGKSGPFWEDSRQGNANDYFEYLGHDVTEQGLGEAARRRSVEIDAGVFSFQGSPHGFEMTPLTVHHGLPEEILALYDIDNYWDLPALKDRLDSLTTLNTWAEVQADIVPRFGGLIISAEAMHELLATPISRPVVRGIFVRLGILDMLAQETSPNGKLSAVGMEILAHHFEGKNARFTDESEGNKKAFKKEMTFPDPHHAGEKIFCPWHGKISSFQIRIHFEWPRPTGQREIKVLYIGPKISKK